MTPAKHLMAVTNLRGTYPVSTRRACQLMHLARSRWYHQSTRAGDGVLGDALREKAAERPREVCRRLNVLLAPDGWQVNRTRLRRFYGDVGLQVLRRKRTQFSLGRVPRPVVTQTHWVRAMDFIRYQRATGLRVRAFSSIDMHAGMPRHGNRRVAALIARRARVFDDVISLRRTPRAITLGRQQDQFCRACARCAGECTPRATRLHPPGNPSPTPTLSAFATIFATSAWTSTCSPIRTIPAPSSQRGSTTPTPSVRIAPCSLTPK